MSDIDAKCARPAPDAALVDIATYAISFEIADGAAYEAARYCLMDALARGFRALADPACAKLLGPVVPGATMAGGARVPGTSYELDPVQAAFNIGAMTGWLAPGPGQPSDSLGGVLAVADYLARKAIATGGRPPSVRDVLTGMIKAHEIQGVTTLENRFDRVGLDHVILVRVASAAVVTAMLGGTHEQVVGALSNAWIDGGTLATCRHAPGAGARGSWAAGDASSRGVRHALLALAGETGCPSALSTATWGFYAVLFEGRPFVYRQPFGSRMMESELAGIEVPALARRFESSIAGVFGARQCDHIGALFADPSRLDAMPVHEFVSAFVRN